jgi:hypothetical protein
MVISEGRLVDDLHELQMLRSHGLYPPGKPDSAPVVSLTREQFDVALRSLRDRTRGREC